MTLYCAGFHQASAAIPYPALFPSWNLRIKEESLSILTNFVVHAHEQLLF